MKVDIDDAALWKRLGLKSGLEIHQQLLSKQKLFCRCTAQYLHKQPSATLLRHMRPTLSEMGTYDGTALMEFKTKKNVTYQVFDRDVCIYEMDDTPPFPVNQDAVDIGLAVALQLDCKIVNEVHISRKQYLDGSIPTGFQRTAIIGIEGQIPFRGRPIRISHLCLEEDACREMSDRGHDVTFRTDRLSIPLVEVVTYPDMRTPREVAEVAREIGRLMRLNGRVRRGAGSVRQDVNVSIEGGTRIEIKGVPKYQIIPNLVAHEALRQRALLGIRDELKKRGLDAAKWDGSHVVVTDEVKGTSSKALKRVLDQDFTVRAVRLPGFAGILAMPLWDGVPFRWDFTGRIAVIACVDEQPNCLADAEIEEAGLEAKRASAVRKAAGCKKEDGLVLVWGSEDDSLTAAKETIIRAKEAISGVPSETRQVKPGGITFFERILPGPDRMYPDTDTPPSPIKDDRIDRIRSTLPTPIWEVEDQLRKTGIPEPHVAALALSKWRETYLEAVRATKIKPVLASWVLVEELKRLEREKYQLETLGKDQLMSLFSALSEGMVLREAAGPVLVAMANGQASNVAEAVRELRLEHVDKKELERTVADAVKKAGKTPRPTSVMGTAMKSLRGRAPGQAVWHEVCSRTEKKR